MIFAQEMENIQGLIEGLAKFIDELIFKDPKFKEKLIKRIKITKNKLLNLQRVFQPYPETTSIQEADQKNIKQLLIDIKSQLNIFGKELKDSEKNVADKAKANNLVNQIIVTIRTIYSVLFSTYGLIFTPEKRKSLLVVVRQLSTQILGISIKYSLLITQEQCNELLAKYLPRFSGPSQQTTANSIAPSWHLLSKR